jgi:hypothetical protein
MQTAVLTQQPISVENFTNLIKDFTRSTSVSLTYFVDDSRSRTIKGEKQIQKLVRISNNAYLNHDYTNKVKVLSGDNTFVAHELKGKTRISSTILQSQKTNEFMLDIKVLRTEKVELLGYFHNGKEITEAEAISMELWAPIYYNPTPKKTAGRGLVSEQDDFNMITPYISRICLIKFNGTEYLINK